MLTCLFSCIIHILYTGCDKIKKNNSGAKTLRTKRRLKQQVERKGQDYEFAMRNQKKRGYAKSIRRGYVNVQDGRFIMYAGQKVYK